MNITTLRLSSAVAAGVVVWCIGLPVAATASVHSCTDDALTEVCAVSRALARPEWETLIREERAAAVARADAAGLWSNPVFGVQHAQVFDAGGSDMEDVFILEQRFPISGRLGLVREAAERRLEGSDWELAHRRLLVVDRTRRLFHEALARGRRLSLIEEAQERLSRAEGDVERRERAGDVSRYDLLRVFREKSEVETTFRVAQAELAYVELRLASLAGLEQRVTPSGALLPTEPLVPEEELTDLLLRRPDIRAFEVERDASRLELKAAQRSRWPDLSVGAGLKTVGGGGERATGFVVGLSVPLPVFDRGQAEEAGAIGRASRAEGRRALVVREALGELRALWARCVEAERIVTDYRETALRSARRLLETAERAYRAGELDVLVLMDACRGLLQAELRVVELEHSARVARLTLDLMTGRTTL